MKKNLLLIFSVFTFTSSLLAQSNSTPVVIDMIPNTKDFFATPTLYISEQPVTPEAYCAFLNATATSNDPHGLYNPQWDDATHFPNLLCIAQSGDSTHGFTYTLVNGETNIIATVNGIPTYKTNPPTTNSFGKVTPGTVEPVYKKVAKRTVMKGVSMANAARFCNWLSHNQAYGPEGDYTTETGSYTFSETNSYGTAGQILLAQKDPHDTTTRELKEVYKNVTRMPNSSWRLPSEAEIDDVINNWGNVDTGEVFWCWTDTIYPHCWQTKIADIPLIFNGAGYRHIKNAPEIFTDRTKLYLYQDLFVSDTGFRVVFTPDNPPAGGFRVFIPSAIQ
ncbi:MAG: hypothetical protein FJ390_07320 [Verrucomicrobia bacterium]|nr:hypothetical protein [Verrucomicrobiota bacterium]